MKKLLELNRVINADSIKEMKNMELEKSVVIIQKLIFMKIAKLYMIKQLLLNLRKIIKVMVP